jgi:hypothetical protein
MNIPYRTRRVLKRLAVILLIVCLIIAVAALVWFLWLQRFVVYTRDKGAVFDMSLPDKIASGELAQKPKPPEDISIYYNEGENSLNTSNDLQQFVGYYADTAALADGVGTVLSQVQALPAGTPVMVDVKSPKGGFYYSSSVSSSRYSGINAAAMDELIDYLADSDIYAIARLPALRDYAYGLNHVPDGLPTAGGYLWADEDYCYWLNPGSQGTMTYLIQIVTELKNLGFDEVVFQDFYFPDTNEIVFKADKAQTLATAAKTLVTTCTTDTFTVSFVGQADSFTLPEGRCRLYAQGVSAALVESYAMQAGIEDPAKLVFLTEIHDTRFDTYSVLRPLDAAH